MKGLIYRDFVILRPSLKTLGLSLIAILAVFLYMNQGMLLIVAFPIMFSFLAIGNFQVDAASHWKKASRMMPITSKEIVLSRYMTSLLLYLIGIAVAVIYGYIYLSNKGVEDISYQLFRTLGIGAGLPLFYSAIFHPCAYYFKGERLEQAMIICMLIMFAVFGGVALLLKALSVDFQYRDLNLYILIFFLGSLAMFFISYVVSHAVFKNDNK